jgi:hypothetical protein
MKSNNWKIATISLLGVLVMLFGIYFYLTPNLALRNIRQAFIEKQETTLIPKQETILSVEAALVLKSGDVKPIARTEFFLLNKNFETILQETKFNSALPNDLKDRFSKRNPLRGFAVIAMFVQGNSFNDPVFKSKKDESNALLQKTMNAIRYHTVYATITDFQGKAQFKNIKPGEYYLLGYSEVDDIVIWNLKTLVKSGQNSVVLDQKNAAPVY